MPGRRFASRVGKLPASHRGTKAALEDLVLFMAPGLRRRDFAVRSDHLTATVTVEVHVGWLDTNQLRRAILDAGVVPDCVCLEVVAAGWVKP